MNPTTTKYDGPLPCLVVARIGPDVALSRAQSCPDCTLLPSPGAVLGVVGALAAVAVMALPETGGEAIPETIGDAAAQQVELVAGAAPGAGTQLSVDFDVDRAQGGREGDGGVTTCERPNERLLGGQEMSDATR